MSDTRTRYTATYLWPGSLFSETKSVDVPEPTPEAAAVAMPADIFYGSVAFGFYIYAHDEELFRSATGGQRWLLVRGPRMLGRWYYGQAYDQAGVEALARETGADYRTLLSNMRGNGWDRMVRTHAGNWQPLIEEDVVLDPATHPHAAVIAAHAAEAAARGR